jgi:hypothetical protein
VKGGGAGEDRDGADLLAGDSVIRADR